VSAATSTCTCTSTRTSTYFKSIDLIC
jgi:hypothetical protein